MPALDGMRVLDMTQYEAGTSCTQHLGWMGADVVKVEPPTGDPGRGVVRDPVKVSQYFLNYNSNKRSIVLDLSTKEGHDIIMQMAPKYDVFVENYGPGVCEKLGLTYEKMKEANPGIIYARIKGFGTFGPYSQYNAYEWIAQSAAGTFSITGEPSGPPTWIQPSFGDSGTGLQTAYAIVSAYVKKQRTGEGELIETSMQEAVTLFMRTAGLATWGEAPQMRMGNRRGAPSGIYKCKGDGPNDYVTLMVVTARQWDSFCIAMDRPELATDPRFDTSQARQDNAEDLYKLVGEWFIQYDKYEAMERVASLEVPCSAVLDTLDLFNNPHLQARNFVQTLQHKTAGEVKVFRNPVLTSNSGAPLRAAPLLGEHTEEVLAADLGLSKEKLGALRERGAIG